jgi:hypothetical protein
MHHDVGHTGGISSVLLTVFATVVSWQEQAEWLFRISSLLLACTVSVVVLYGHYKKSKKKKV